MTNPSQPANDHEGNWYVLIFGLPPLEEPQTLAPGISLLPLKKPLHVFDLAALGSVGFREWAALEPIIAGCSCEIESAVDSATGPGFDALNRGWLAVALLAVRGYGRVNGVAVSSYRWQDVPTPDAKKARMDLPPFKGGMLDLHFKMMSLGDQPDESLTDSAKWLAYAFPIANKLSSESNSFYLALQAAADWRFSPDARSAVARLWSGIEAIFSISSELVFRISLLSASLLAPRGEDRLKRFRDTKKLYGLRSKAVHGDKLSDEKLNEAVEGSFNLLRDLLLLIFDRGKMFTQEDFDEAVFL